MSINGFFNDINEMAKARIEELDHKGNFLYGFMVKHNFIESLGRLGLCKREKFQRRISVTKSKTTKKLRSLMKRR